MTTEYDLWLCITNGRTGYQATPVETARESPLKPPNAVEHLGRAFATNNWKALQKTITKEFRRTIVGPKLQKLREIRISELREQDQISRGQS